MATPFNSDYFLEQDYEAYQKRLCEAEFQEKEAMCDKCGSHREIDTDGTVLNMDCKGCDEIENQKWLKENGEVHNKCKNCHGPIEDEVSYCDEYCQEIDIRYKKLKEQN